MSIPEWLQLPVIIVVTIAIIVGILWVIFMSVRVYNKKIILEWRENGTIITVNGTIINPNDIRAMEEPTGGVMVFHIKNGQVIKSSQWTIVTPPPTQVEKTHE